MREWVAWVNETPASIALRESLYLWPMIEASHVLTIMLFFGTIVMVDLRVLGVAFRGVSIAEMTGKILPWTIAGFALMVITGLLLVYAKPLIYYHSVFFRAKMVVLVLALANILAFHQLSRRDPAGWTAAAPAPARASAGASLAAWAAIIILGRMVAYDWYNCEKLVPGGLLHTLADCPAPASAMLGGL